MVGPNDIPPAPTIVILGPCRLLEEIAESLIRGRLITQEEGWALDEKVDSACRTRSDSDAVVTRHHAHERFDLGNNRRLTDQHHCSASSHHCVRAPHRSTAYHRRQTRGPHRSATRTSHWTGTPNSWWLYLCVRPNNPCLCCRRVPYRGARRRTHHPSFSGNSGQHLRRP